MGEKTSFSETESPGGDAQCALSSPGWDPGPPLHLCSGAAPVALGQVGSSSAHFIFFF